MRKKIIYCLLVVLLSALVGQTVRIVGNCYTTRYNVQFNVLIEGVIETPYGNQYWIGSGVIIGKDGIIITARHCVEGASFIKVTLQTGRSYFVNTWLMSGERDIAVFQIPIEFEDVAIIGDSDILEQGDKIYNIGNPLGVWENKIIKCKVEKSNWERLAFCDSNNYVFIIGNIKSGCSGGGVYYGRKLIGIVSLGGNGICLLIPSEDVKELLNEYKEVLL